MMTDNNPATKLQQALTGCGSALVSRDRHFQLSIDPVWVVLHPGSREVVLSELPLQNLHVIFKLLKSNPL